MIINWLLYSLMVGGILAIAGIAFEFGARAMRLPTRWVWIVVMSLGTMLSAMKLGKGLLAHEERVVSAYAVPTAESAIDSDSVPARVWSAREVARSRPQSVRQSLIPPVVYKVLNSTGGLTAAIGVNEESYRSYNLPLLIGCGAFTLLALVVLAVTFARLNGVAYALDHGMVEGVSVLLSRNIGPALLGITRFRVVLPRWVTEMPAADVRTILAHEQEHALAGDPTLTLAALVMTALQPWNAAMWFMLSRIRLATEADCDARVLGVDGDVRRYGHLLVNVYQRSQPGLSPLTSFVTRTSQLEARVRRMVTRAPVAFSAKTFGAVASALLLCSLAYSIEVTAQRGVMDEEMYVPVEAAQAKPPTKVTVQQKATTQQPINQGPYLEWDETRRTARVRTARGYESAKSFVKRAQLAAFRKFISQNSVLDQTEKFTFPTRVHVDGAVIDSVVAERAIADSARAHVKSAPGKRPTTR